MVEIVRKALMGDKKAQAECSEESIILPCPMCYEEVEIAEVVEGPAQFEILFRCPRYGIEVRKSQEFVHNGKEYIPYGPNPLRQWNDRDAPPVGKCADCAYCWTGNTKQGETSVCRLSGMEVFYDEFCSRFQPGK